MIPAMESDGHSPNVMTQMTQWRNDATPLPFSHTRASGCAHTCDEYSRALCLVFSCVMVPTPHKLWIRVYMVACARQLCRCKNHGMCALCVFLCVPLIDSERKTCAYRYHIYTGPVCQTNSVPQSRSVNPSPSSLFLSLSLSLSPSLCFSLFIVDHNGLPAAFYIFPRWYVLLVVSVWLCWSIWFTICVSTEPGGRR